MSTHQPEHQAETGAHELGDVRVPAAVTHAETVFDGAIFDITRETFTMPGEDAPITREFMTHPGAVGILAVDEHGRILLQKQRRQPVRAELWEVPAGLLDVEGEPALDAARRELAEEADLRADTWHVLADHYMSPGCSSEAMRIYLAQDLHEIPENERHERTEEEAFLEPQWVPFEDAVTAVLSGRIGNPTTVVGILALAAHKARGNQTLRPADASWPARPRHA